MSENLMAAAVAAIVAVTVFWLERFASRRDRAATQMAELSRSISALSNAAYERRTADIDRGMEQVLELLNVCEIVIPRTERGVLNYVARRLLEADSQTPRTGALYQATRHCLEAIYAWRLHPVWWGLVLGIHSMRSGHMFRSFFIPRAGDVDWAAADEAPPPPRYSSPWRPESQS